MEYALADYLLLNFVNDKFIRSLNDAKNTDSSSKQEKWDEKNARAAAKLKAICLLEMQQILDGTTGKSAKEKYDILKKRCTASGLAAK